MTLAHSQPSDDLDRLEREFLARYGHLLPLRCEARAVDLYAKRDGVWAREAGFGLGG